ncbi:YwdI family protein [Priestia taiwanensis]|uniref:Uncharacterized protein n=1 Tax=Priestia taiwanensis TaxID=1347902 RepID=A0A917AXC6_9BACI|nr:YwdI family protein [Priestia taiwanensis]MBM7364931.1 hypothetical protein [Priestia taiwanensis]GGE82447.1 hypothetical protein GCM10007140_35110 [Priestia taiwanensis]
MQIGAEKLIQKMMKELQGALVENGNEQKVREHMLVVRSLCDVMLDKEEGYTAPSYTIPSPAPTPVSIPAQVHIPSQSVQQPIVMPSTTKEVQGESLLDF